VKILGISFDGIEANRKFAEKYQFNFPLLCDVEKKIGLAYGATDSVDRDAPKRMSFLIGADGKIEKVWPKVSAGAHPGEVLASLAE
jgi:thioredoxin-dependent peroxiredoxin